MTKMATPLPARLRRYHGEETRAVRYEAAARIEALEADLDFERGQCARLAKILDARDAVIAEALAYIKPFDLSTVGEGVRLILSRVPQGAAEPEHPYGIDCSEKCRRDAEEGNRG